MGTSIDGGRHRQATGLLATGLLVALALALSSCAVPATPAAAARPTAGLGAHNDTSTPSNLVSVPALARHRYDGRDLRLGPVVDRGPVSTTYALSYRSGELLVTGVMDVPVRPGRSSLVVLAHGWTDPSRYRSGGMLGRERAALAAAGFVALQVDYRNHAGSDREPPGTRPRPLGYPEDVVNAVLAVREADLPFVDAARVGLFGRSMGGGVALNVLAAVPGLADAAVLSSPVSSSAAENFGRWVAQSPALRSLVVESFGTPATRPGLWRRVSSRSYLDRVDVPVLVHHGSADRVCPPGWSRATVVALRDAGGEATLAEYPGERHRYGEAWPLMMERTVGFFGHHLS